MTISELLKSVAKFLRLWVMVAPWEQCVRIRAGKHVKSLPPGMHLALPLLDRFIVEKTTLRTSNVYAQTLSIPGGPAQVFRLVVRYRVVDLLTLCETTACPEDVLLDTVATEAARRLLNGGGLSFEVEVPGLEIVSIKPTDLFTTARAYRLAMDKITEYNWGDKVDLRGAK